MTKGLSSLAMGRVSLNVADLSGMKDFYHDMLGLDIIKEDKKTVTLGVKNNPLIELHASEHGPSDRAHAGLYHFALLFSAQKALAKRISHILRSVPHHFSGSADHLVSEAFYFTDPEGNGIELYFDRDKREWKWVAGQIQMATLYIDPVSYIQKHLQSPDTEHETSMGHVHLKVGDIETAHEFYVKVLGFDVTAQLPGALFISVDGYHHHIGLNSWESTGAGVRVPSMGLKSFEIIFSDKKNIEVLKKRLKDQDIAFAEEQDGISLHDPWNNAIYVRYLPAARISASLMPK